MTLTPCSFQSMCAVLAHRRHLPRQSCGYEIVTPLSTGNTWPVTMRQFVGGEIQRAIGDVVGLDQPEQVRVGELLQCGVAGHQPLYPLGHRRRRGDRVDPHLLRRIGDRQRAGDRGDAALGGGVAVAPGTPISATFELMLMTEPPPDLAIAGMPKRQPRKVPYRSSLMARQNSSSGASTAVLSAAVEPPALLCSTCSPPKWPTVRRIACSRLSGSVTSVWIAIAPLPARCAVSSPLRASISATATRRPRGRTAPPRHGRSRCPPR